MNKAIEFSARHPVSVLMLFSLLVILGAAGAFFLNASLLPQTKDRWILVVAKCEGERAGDVRKLVALPLEESLSGMKNVKNLESVSRDGVCAIKIELNWSADADAALLEANAILDAAMETLPDCCSRPQAKKISASSGQVSICVVPKNASLAAASDFARHELKSKILGLEEAASVEILGAQDLEIKIIVDSKKAAFYGLSLEDIAERANLSNFDYPAGTVREGDDEILLKTDGNFKSFSEILDTTIKSSQGRLKIGDIARVEKSLKKSSAFNFCGSERCVEILAQCKKNRNPLKFGKKVKGLLKEINGGQENFLLFAASDSADEIAASLKSLSLASLAGIAAVFALTGLFFGSLKIASLIASVIPLSVLFSTLALLAFGKSANIISIAGMTLSLGMIVDNSIVAMQSVIEGAKQRESFLPALEKSVKKIALENSASTVTTIIVFAPVFFIGGIIGELFCDLGITVFAGMAFSLLFSFTVIPASCALFFKSEVKAVRIFDLSAAQNKYEALLKKTNKIKFLCPAASLASIVLAALLLLPIKKELEPKGRQNAWTASIAFEPGTSAETIEKRAKALGQSLSNAACVERVLLSGGLEESAFERLADPNAFRERLLVSVLSSDAKKSKAACERIFKDLKLDYAFEERGGVISERLSIKDWKIFFGESPELLLAECKKRFGKNFFPRQTKSVKVFKASKGALENAGVTPLSLSVALKSSFDGREAFPYYENGKEIAARVQYEENEFSSKAKLAALKIPSQKGMQSLSALGRWEEETSECVFYRRNGKDAKIVFGGAKGAAEFLSLKKQNMSELLENGALLLCLALVFLYCVLGAQTESFSKPLEYLLAVPPAFFGAALFLALFGSSLNINSIMAFAALFGSSVNSAIILREGGTKKLSAVLITSATSIASLLPFAFDPLGLNPQSSLALALAGGLAFSTAASLVLIPNGMERKNESV